MVRRKLSSVVGSCGASTSTPSPRPSTRRPPISEPVVITTSSFVGCPSNLCAQAHLSLLHGEFDLCQARSTTRGEASTSEREPYIRLMCTTSTHHDEQLPEAATKVSLWMWRVGSKRCPGGLSVLI